MAFLAPKIAFAGDFVISNFGGGLDTLDTPAEISPSMAQDLLNVNLQPGGGSVFKRDGYGLFQSLPSASTSSVHGGYHFQQLGGNDVQLWGSDQWLSGSVNDGAFVELSSSTDGVTWQCTDSQGQAYCFTSAGDTPVQTDGTKANTFFESAIPLGTMGTFTPLQLVVAGVSGNANTVYVSAQNNFLNFTIGILPSSPFTEPIASPGSRITHLAYYFGRLFWWKDQSFGYATFTNQNDWQLTIVSNQIGTLDNSDAFWNSSGFDSGAKFSGTQQANGNASPGGIFFRGQDNHLYVYDGYYLTRLSRIITPTITTANRKKANSWTQTTQADFQGGISSPTHNLSFTSNPGDIVPSSFSVTENSASSGWSSGSSINFSIGTSSLSLITNNSGNVTNNDFETSGALPSGISNWTDSGASWCIQSTSLIGTCTVNPKSGSELAQCNGIFGNISVTFEVIRADNGSLLSSVSIPQTGDCVYRQITLTDNADSGKRVQFRFHATDTGNPGTPYYLTTNDNYIFGGSISFWHAEPDSRNIAFDLVQNGSSTITTGSFTSRTYNMGTASATWSVSNFAWTVNTSTPTFDLQTATATTGPWTEVLTTSSTNKLSNQYARYTSTISITNVDSALTAITGVSVIAESSGTYYSAVNNAPNLTSWGILTLDDATPGASAITYYTRASTSSFTVNSGTPTWTLQSKNSTVTSSTGTWMQLRADFAITAATEVPDLSDFTFNWFEGTASDKAYMTYFNDAIWFAVSSGTSVSADNRIFYWDLLNGAWLIYDIPANGFLIENNALYFGSPTNNAIYKFGGVPTDNGGNINSYWRSKTFYTPTVLNPYNPPSFEDAFVQKEFQQADFVLGESSTTLSYTYTVDSKTSTVYTMTAYDASASLIQRNFLLPVGKIGKYYDFKIGDNSSQAPWKLMGHRVHYNPLNWRPVTS